MKHAKKLLLVFTLFLLASCIPRPQGSANESAVPPQAPGVEFGDLVTVNFVLSLENGTVADTNDPELAQQYGLVNYVKGPYVFVLGQSGKISGFDKALVGMRQGERRETDIEPTEKEIVLQLNKTVFINRFVTLDRRQAFPKSMFQEIFGKPPIIGDIVFNKEKFPFKYQITNLTNKSAIAKIMLKQGEEYELPNTFWKSKVARVADEDAQFYMIPEDNQTIPSPFGPATIHLSKSRIAITYQPELNSIVNRSIEVAKGFSIPQQFQVIDVQEDGFTIKRYGALADKRLHLTVELLNLTAGVKEVREGTKNLVEIEV